jgi:large subunit ribosomal protein L13
MKTVSIKPSDVKKRWYVVDATNQTVGRLATEIARVLRGKNKPTFTPHVDTGDFVVVVNAEKVAFTGNKWRDKHYYHHSQYMGGIKAASAAEVLKSHPDRILHTAVKGMLKRNRLNRQVIKNLKIYAGAEHPHAAQNPIPLAPRVATSGASSNG